MVYAVTINTASLTPEASAKETLLDVGRGLIYRMEILFPPGPLGLLHCQVFDGNYQLFPASVGASFHSNNEVIGFDDLYLKQAAPWHLKIKTWNDDDTYEHELQVRVGLASEKAFMSRFMPSISWDKFAEVLKETEKSQENEKQGRVQAFFESLK